MALQGGIFGQRAAQSSQGGALRELALFTVGKVLCGVNLQEVQEVLAAPSPAGEAGSGVIPLPEAPLFVEGVINLRGQTLPIVDLRKRFGLAGEKKSEVRSQAVEPRRAGATALYGESGVGGARRAARRGRVLVIRIAGQPRGFLVDAVAGILRVPAAGVEPPPKIGKPGSSYLQGVARQGDRLVLLLDLEQVLTREEHLRLDEVLRKSRQPACRPPGSGTDRKSGVRSQEKGSRGRGVQGQKKTPLEPSNP